MPAKKKTEQRDFMAAPGPGRLVVTGHPPTVSTGAARAIAGAVLGTASATLRATTASAVGEVRPPPHAPASAPVRNLAIRQLQELRADHANPAMWPHLEEKWGAALTAWCKQLKRDRKAEKFECAVEYLRPQLEAGRGRTKASRAKLKKEVMACCDCGATTFNDAFNALSPD